MDASAVEPVRWTFTTATPAGDVHSTYHLTADALEFQSDALWDGGRVTLPWSAVVEAGTTQVDMPVGPGAPDLGRFVPGTLEWLVARGGGSQKPFMRPLPPAPARDALIASVRERLGARWTGEGIPLAEARQRFGLQSRGEGLKAAGLVLGVLLLLALLIILLGVLLSPIFLFPAGFALGGWLFHSGLAGLRDAIAVANTPTARIGSAALGLVEIEGLAQTAHSSPAAVSGRTSVWWDVAVEAWYEGENRRGGRWQQLAARHGGTMDALHVEDGTGRVRVWPKRADLLLREDCWETGKDTLPSSGIALLQDLGFAWQGRMRVRETRVEADAPVYVLGTLDERRTIEPAGDGWHLATLIRSGDWRPQLIRRLPRWLGLLVAVLSGFLGIVLGVGRGGERVTAARDSAPPDMAPHELLVWKGSVGRPFIISNQREGQALTALRRRSMYRGAAGMGVLCYCVYQLLQYF